MDNDELFERVRRVVAEAQGVPVWEVTRETRLPLDGGDSLDLVEIVMALEEQLQIEIPDAAAEAMTVERLRGWTVGDLVDYLHDYLG